MNDKEVNPALPTEALPGSPEKIELLEARYQLGLPLFLEDDVYDRRIKPPNGRGWSWADYRVRDLEALDRFRLQCVRVLELYVLGFSVPLIAQEVGLRSRQVGEVLRLAGELEGLPQVTPAPPKAKPKKRRVRPPTGKMKRRQPRSINWVLWPL
jgi:hypothetical protein